VPADTTTYRYSGDFKRCLRLKPLAQQGVLVLSYLMSAGNLSTYMIRRVLEDGSSIKVYSGYGATYVDIFGVKEKEEEEKKNPVSKEKEKSLVMVYVGDPKTPFSKYTVAELAEQSKRLWNTIPDVSLETIAEKKLLVLPCPVRGLTTDETNIILKFLEGKRNRIAVFSGSDFTSTNLVLGSLNSRLQCIGRTDSHIPFYSNMSGFLPLSSTTQQLFWTLVKTAGQVVVHPDYWNTAVVKDWCGYGVIYNNITNVVPALYYIDTESEEGDDWSNHFKRVDYYLYTDLLNKGAYDGYTFIHTDYDTPEDKKWFFAFPNGWQLGFYPSSYITWNYTSLKITTDAIKLWCRVNMQYLPINYVYRTTPPTTDFSFGKYFNYSDTPVISNAMYGSFLAYADNEKIIVGSFEPTFLTGITGWSNSLLMQHYKTQDFADWLLMYDMVPNKNMFNTKSCFVLDMPWHYYLSGAQPYFTAGIQY
jgi:hypothetical protein